jgi:transcription antitermination factor NusG
MSCDASDTRAAEWYAVRTRSNFEKQAAAQIGAKGFEIYLPAFRELHQWKDRTKAIDRPLFPGYLFARTLDTNERRLMILKSAGVVQILGTGNSIEPVPDQQVESVKRMLDASISCFAHPYLREGTRVRIRRGILKGLQGLLVRFKNAYRLVLSVDLLCQSVATEVDIQDVEPMPHR